MVAKIIIFIFFLQGLIFSEVLPTDARTWIRAAYWTSDSGFPISDINSALFTHLLCGFPTVDPTSYQLSLHSLYEPGCSNFTDIVRRKNPSVSTLLSIGGTANDSVLSSMVRNDSSRKSFIDSSIKAARLSGYGGLDFAGFFFTGNHDFRKMGILLGEWRAAIESEARNFRQEKLILTATVKLNPGSILDYYPIDSIKDNLDWIHVQAYDYYSPSRDNSTGPHGALYDPRSSLNVDYGINSWIDGGVTSNKLVLILPFFGYAWRLKNPEQNGIFAPATGPAITAEGFMPYNDIKKYIKQYGVKVIYNSTYVAEYCIINGTTWIGFDDVEVVRTKVSYAKEKKLLGYNVWQVPYDDNWVLSQAAAQVDGGKGKNTGSFLAIILPTTASGILFLGFLLYYFCRMKRVKSEVESAIESHSKVTNPSAAGDFTNNAPNLIVYSLAEIETATDNFSFENKLGEGGYGPVYKGMLQNGQEIAVKKLSKTSTQGYEEFTNELMLTAKLQHVNLVKLLGFCTDREEQMIVYEYMPNKSLDYYLFDPVKRLILNWKKRVDIIEGVVQGLLYLQEYSRLTIIHRDLKASNILLDDDRKPKISDFGMARIFAKDDLEAKTGRIVGTYGYVSPEYVRTGKYSTKSDVYSFGVLLLQIISGKRVSSLYGPNENLTLLEYAYDLWKDSKGREYFDKSLDDTDSPCKLMRCLKIALLCVQESPNDRPSMLEVFSILKNESTEVPIPKKPAFSKRTVEDEVNKSALQVNMCSVNDNTVSEVVAR